MNHRQALKSATKRLEAVSATPRLDATWLLSAVRGCDSAHFLAYPEATLSDDEIERYEGYVMRRLAGEPIAYILGEVGFYDVMLGVSPAVLIPRPETEGLVEEALSWAREAMQGWVAADIGTGSGAIGVTVARHAPHLMMYATDISEAALAVARDNARRLGVSVTMLQGDLALPLSKAGVRVHLLMANLPYIAHDDLPALEVTKHEPHLALDGGTDGLVLIRRLLEQLSEVCHEGALVLLEIGTGQGEAVSKLAQEAGGDDVVVLRDYAQHERIVRFVWGG